MLRKQQIAWWFNVMYVSGWLQSSYLFSRDEIRLFKIRICARNHRKNSIFMKRWRRSQVLIKSEYFAMYWKFSWYKTRQTISQLTFCLIHGWCASQNLVSYTCSIVSFSFFLRSWIIHCPSIFVPVRHMRPTCRVDWLTFLMCHLVVASFTIVALWASRDEVWSFFAFDTSRNCRKSDCPTKYLIARSTYLIPGLSIWLID